MKGCPREQGETHPGFPQIQFSYQTSLAVTAREEDQIGVASSVGMAAVSTMTVMLRKRARPASIAIVMS